MSDAPTLFPAGVEKLGEETREMKFFRQSIITMLMVVGLSLAAFGQRDDQKKPPPPKDPDRPKIEPAPKNPPKNDGPKRPGSYFVLMIEERKNENA